MAFRVIHRAGPYVVRQKAGPRRAVYVKSIRWIEGPGLPADVPGSRNDAWLRHGQFHDHVDAIKALADQLAKAYQAGRETVYKSV